MYTRSIQFTPCLFEVHDGWTLTTFWDGSVNEMHAWALSDDLKYREIARQHGYGNDWLRYAVDHDITHHWWADYGGYLCSEAIWLGARGVNIPQKYWHWSLSHEEHMVNSIQKYVQTGEIDAWNWLGRLFGDDLPVAAASLQKLLTPVSSPA
jgi:hypothetical protein